MKKYPRILFFIKGTLPSDEAQDIADSLGPNVAFRNANFVPDVGCLEKCDGVAGEVPARYKKAFPAASKAIEAFEEQREANRVKIAENKKARKEAVEAVEAKAKPNAKPEAKPEAKPKWKANA